MKLLYTFLPPILLASLIIIGCRKTDTISPENDMPVGYLHAWLKDNGGMYKYGKVGILREGETQPVKGTLDWNRVVRYGTESEVYVYVPYVFAAGVLDNEKYGITFKLDKANNTVKNAAFTADSYKNEIETATKNHLQQYYNFDGELLNTWQKSAGKLNALRMRPATAKEMTMLFSAHQSGGSTSRGKLMVAGGRGENCEVQETVSRERDGYLDFDGTYYAIVRETVSFSLVCHSNGGSSNNEEQYEKNPEGGGGYYTYREEEEEKPEKIIDSLQGYPCAQEILKKMPNLNVEVARIIKETFGESISNNLIYKAGVLIGKDGECNSLVQGYDKVYNTWKVNGNIILNEDLLKYGTQEIILSTMIHEGLHAFIELERQRLPHTDFMAKYGAFGGYRGTAGRFSFYIVSDGHMPMISFIEKIENAISNFNPSLPQNVVQALARYGLITDDFPEDIRKLINNEKDTRKNQNHGKKCN